MTIDTSWQPNPVVHWIKKKVHSGSHSIYHVKQETRDLKTDTIIHQRYGFTKQVDANDLICFYSHCREKAKFDVYFFIKSEDYNPIIEPQIIPLKGIAVCEKHGRDRYLKEYCLHFDVIVDLDTGSMNLERRN